MKLKIISLLRFACLLYLVFLIPKIVSFVSSYTKVSSKKLHVFLGIENLVTAPFEYKNVCQLRFGLICNTKSVDQVGNRTADLLVENGFQLKRIFVHENRPNFETRQMFVTKGGKDSKLGVPIHFLQGNIGKFLKKNRNALRMFSPLEAFFVDIQDEGVNARIISNFLYELLVFSANQGKRVVILDRPNVLGKVIEGPGLIPWRYGLTIGELTLYINRYIVKNPANVTIVPLKRWRRDDFFRVRHNEELALFLQPLSQIRPLYIMPDRQGLYYALLLREKNELSLWERRYLKRLCWYLGLCCLDYTLCGKKHKKMLKGVKLSLKNNVNRFSAFNTLLTITRFLKNRKQISLSFKSRFDREFELSELKKFIQGKISFNQLKIKLSQSLSSFYDKSRHCCLYKPLPIVFEPEIVKA